MDKRARIVESLHRQMARGTVYLHRGRDNMRYRLVRIYDGDSMGHIDVLVKRGGDEITLPLRIFREGRCLDG